ncbi:gamma-glutamylcyclotransferase family protein [Dyadobacter arcticus]|uniref:Gamma-glutamylcyclotransferase (GGCT)/AIG2-like uncharacterized protein YtfP n=1 Tax=Dyadobacter arcticus TaxID=1078754 RepID=A0ABX0URD7_9BACT|nr:gamma-glutamylcyclotransferase family protein [Dyadobacter arcticus]NIJ55549.1 gamma-glutamylcyclotransferase (GGCT)/AIG2-like uncharacterized protein YtfP [Dyadobacter arcticus]
MNADPSFLFTYGTLMQGFYNPFAEKLRLSSSYEGEGYFPGCLYRITWYPGAVYDERAESKVFGEIYKLNSFEILLELDEYEDVLEDEKNSLYVRKIIPVTAPNGLQILCWAYLYNQSVNELSIIPDGRFTNP